MSVYAIIPAAGQGKRFGGAKQLQMLGGRPLFLHAIEALNSSSRITGIVVVVRPDDEKQIKGILQRPSLTKVIKVVPGGQERQDSVRRGFEALPPCDLVLVHDGARPFVNGEIIERVITAAERHGASVAGMPVKETIKRVTTGETVVETVDRSPLWSIQTPQAFRHEIFKRAIEKAAADRFLGTDESMLVERLGEKVKVVLGSPYNIKITTPEDLEIAHAFLEMRRR